MGRRKKGLLHSARKVEVEDVKPSHKKKCEDCGRTPANRRLKVVDGCARAQKVTVYCETCGTAWLRDRWTEYGRAIERLDGDDIDIRV